MSDPVEPRRSTAGDFVLYGVARLVLLALVVVVLYLIGLRGWLLWVAGIVIAALVAYIALAPVEAGARAWLARRAAARSARQGEHRSGSASGQDPEDSSIDAALSASDQVPYPETSAGHSSADRQAES